MIFFTFTFRPNCQLVVTRIFDLARSCFELRILSPRGIGVPTYWFLPLSMSVQTTKDRYSTWLRTYCSLMHIYKHAKPTWTNGNWGYFFLMSVVLTFFALAHVVALVSSQDTRSASCVLASYHWVPLWLCTVSHILIHNDRRSTLQARVPVMWRRRY